MSYKVMIAVLEDKMLKLDTTAPAEWRTETTIRIATAILDNYTWSHLPILADALEEVGCCDDRILHSLRHRVTSPSNLPLLCWLKGMKP